MSSNIIVVNEDDLSNIFKKMFGESFRDFLNTSDFKSIIQGLIPQNKEQNLLSPEDAAEFLHLKVGSIYTLTSQKKMPKPIKRGKRVYFNKADLVKWNEDGRPSCGLSIDETVDDAITIANSKRKIRK